LSAQNDALKIWGEVAGAAVAASFFGSFCR
jgi:hypothetical protein